MLSLRVRKRNCFYSRNIKSIVARLEMGEVEDLSSASTSLLDDCIAWTKDRLIAVEVSREMFEALAFPLPVDQAIQNFVMKDEALVNALRTLKEFRKAAKKREKEQEKQRRAQYRERMSANAPR